MTRLFRSTALCAILVAASPVSADITVDDAWAVWKAQIAAYGLTFDAPETREGDALQIGEINLSITFPQDSGSAYLRFSGPRFTPVGDGSVEVRFPASSQIVAGAEIPGEGSFSVKAATTGGDAPGVMSGDPMKVSSNWDSPGFTATLQEVSVDGKALENVSGLMTLGPLKASSTTEMNDDHLVITGQSLLEKYDMDYSVTISENEEKLTIDAGGSANTIEGSSVITLPRSGLDPLGLHDQLRAGLNLVGNSNVAESRSYQRVRAGEEMISDQTTTGQDYAIQIKLDEDGLDYGGTTGAFDVAMTIAEVPFPIAFAGESVEARMMLPLLKSEAMQQAALKMVLNGVTIDEALWSLFDPEAQLPRDPMTLAVDLGADTSVLFEFLDIRAIMGGVDPGDLPIKANRVTLNNLTLAAAGAELTGQGAFAIDYDDMTTFDGMPALEGEASFVLKGFYELIDKLTALGLITSEDAMGTNMLIGMFFTPEERSYVLTSEIEVKKTGEVLANGQRLR